MFDFSRLGETIGGLFGGASQVQELASGGIGDLIQNAGISPEMLQGLSEGQIMELLSQHGIDLASLAPDQLSELMNSLGIEGQLGSIGEVATSWLGGDNR